MGTARSRIWRRRLIVSIAEHIRTELIEKAVGAAALTRDGLTGAVFHTDRESYCISYGFAILYAKLVSHNRRER